VADIRLGDKEGYIDRTGEIIVKPQFKEVLYFDGPLSQISISDDEWGYMTRAGKFVGRAPESERPIYFEHDRLEGMTPQEIEDSCK
jgi:hypothetical protein